MYQVFKDMVKQIFNTEQFVEYCFINGFKTKCICSTINDNLVYTAAGLQSDENFTLDLQIDQLETIPKQGDRVIFRDKTYKISSTSIDSAHASMKIYLIALSKGA